MTTREKIDELISELALEAFGVQGPVRFGSRPPLDTADMKAARAKVNAAIDALFDRLDAQETALVAADRLAKGLHDLAWRGFTKSDLVAYDTARAATRTTP